MIIGKQESDIVIGEDGENKWKIFTGDEIKTFGDFLIKYTYVVPTSFLNEIYINLNEWRRGDKIYMPEYYYRSIINEHEKLVNQYRKLLGKELINWEY